MVGVESQSPAVCRKVRRNHIRREDTLQYDKESLLVVDHEDAGTSGASLFPGAVLQWINKVPPIRRTAHVHLDANPILLSTRTNGWRIYAGCVRKRLARERPATPRMP